MGEKERRSKMSRDGRKYNEEVDKHEEYKQYVKRLPFKEALKHHGFLTTIMYKFPNLPIYISLATCIVSAIAMVILVLLRRNL